MKSLVPALACCALVLGCTAKYLRETTAEVVEATPQRIERGDYIVNQLASCGACHTTRDSGSLVDGESTTMFLGGGNLIEDTNMGVAIWAPNITSDSETGVGSWTDDQLIRAIRDGVRPDGSFMFPLHPYASYQYMSDEDVRSVVAYLRSVPKVKQTKPRQERKMPFMLGVVLSMGAMAHSPAKEVPQPDPANKIAYGQYISNMGHCWECHSMGDTGPRGPETDAYLGGSKNAFGVPRVGLVWGSNLTPEPETGIAKYTDEQFKQTLLTGKRFDGKAMAAPMSFFTPHLSGMKPEDMDALIAYIRSVKPVKNKVPERQLTPEGKKLAGEL